MSAGTSAPDTRSRTMVIVPPVDINNTLLIAFFVFDASLRLQRYYKICIYAKKVVLLHKIFQKVTTKLLIIDSDISLSIVLCDYLASRGYKAQHVAQAREAFVQLDQSHYDMVLMEMQNVGMNGYELLREIRHRYAQLPIIVLTTRSEREAQMKAFQLGCDDYQLKPFSMDLLICRIEAILRRVRRDEENKQRVFELDGHIFDAVHQIFDGQHLSGRESELLLMLCRHQDEIVDRHRILASLWKEDNAFTSRSLGVFINHLRSFLRPIGYTILAVRGKGYKLVRQEEGQKR